MQPGARILVVDDELIVRESLQGWLEEEGYEIQTAESAEVALSLIGRQEFDIAFLDIKCPESTALNC